MQWKPYALLLCPVKEYDWIDILQCELVHTNSGFNALECVFKAKPTAFAKQIGHTLNDPAEFTIAGALEVRLNQFKEQMKR
jgi:hypothetical protein